MKQIRFLINKFKYTEYTVVIVCVARSPGRIHYSKTNEWESVCLCALGLFVVFGGCTLYNINYVGWIIFQNFVKIYCLNGTFHDTSLTLTFTFVFIFWFFYHFQSKTHYTKIIYTYIPGNSDSFGACTRLVSPFHPLSVQKVIWMVCSCTS